MIASDRPFLFRFLGLIVDEQLNAAFPGGCSQSVVFGCKRQIFSNGQL